MDRNVSAHHITFCNVAPPYVGKILVDLGQKASVLYIAKDDKAMELCEKSLIFFNTTAQILKLPSWDCLPFDRVGPSADICADRVATLCRLLQLPQKNYIVLTTVNALMQKVMPRHSLEGKVLPLRVGSTVSLHSLRTFLVESGFRHTQTVREPGEFSVRGGIVDVFPGGSSDRQSPVRLDFFDDTLEAISPFDLDSQRSANCQDTCTLYPIAEVLLNDTTRENFQHNYKKTFGENTDMLCESISQGMVFQGCEHWLTFFYNGLETLFDYLPSSTQVVLCQDFTQAFKDRQTDIATYYRQRKDDSTQDRHSIARIPPRDMFISHEVLLQKLRHKSVTTLTPYALPSSKDVVDMNAKNVEDFTAIRQQNITVFNHLQHLVSKANIPVIIACDSPGIKQHCISLLRKKGFSTTEIHSFKQRDVIKSIGVCLWEIERGFISQHSIVYAYTDIFGKKVRLSRTKRHQVENFLTETHTLDKGDLIVHTSFGIGRYEGLELVEVGTSLHDCIKVAYADNASVFVPVENMDVLSKYGGATHAVNLDKLGGSGWKVRKAKMENRIGILAQNLIELAASRSLQKVPAFDLSEKGGNKEMYEAFIARFAFAETDDQSKAISEVLEDLQGEKPMDRVICGDVGFGKTEVALRAALVSVLNGAQVAVVVPTTLLARQHYETFRERFKGFPIKIGHMSRLVNQKNMQRVKEALQQGKIDIVIATHCIFAKSVRIPQLGLLVIDEEQHFGVAQKESLKALKHNVHVLSLSATPIPRTLQMALTGVRDMSVIATPPVDRLAIRTFVLPYDKNIIKDAIVRERLRAGKVFYVCPRLTDLDTVFQQVKKLVPGMRIAVAHGKLPARQLDMVMTQFMDNMFDILLTTNIIESGIHIPTANTMIIHRADMFGLSQLYQLRGRIGRRKVRAYCYLTTPVNAPLTSSAKRRLEVMQTLDTLGAGFTIASHDLDIRGAGNVLGDEQSGHIKEVGIEFYQHMLEEEIAKRLREKNHDNTSQSALSPSPAISIAITVFIPATYVENLQQRIALYRRLSALKTLDDMDTVLIEMVDRFGKMPSEVENLLKVVELKILCMQANIEKIEVGEKGAIITLYSSAFKASEKIIGYIQKNMDALRIRPDQKIFVGRAWKNAQDCLHYLKNIAKDFAKLVSSP